MKSFITKKINRLINKNYSLAKARKYKKYCNQHTSLRNPLIIYQMGKVGSSTLVRSFRESGVDMDIFQIHFLTSEWIDIVDDQYKNASKVHNKFILDEHWLASKFLNQKLAENKNARWKVISLVRDPIARNISTFFQAFDVYFPEDAKKFSSDNADLAGQSDELIDIFLNKFKEHEVPLNWYDIHIKPIFNIDIFATEFPISKGFQILKGENIDMLILRLEDLNTTASEAVDKFLGIKGFTIASANISKDKGYADAYSIFKDQINLPQKYIDNMYSSRFMNHFYSGEEIEKLRAKWTK